MTKTKITKDIVRELLNYDPYTGEFVWKPRRMEWFKREQDWRVWNKKFSGKPAGCVRTRKDGSCYLAIGLLNKNYHGSQLAHLYMHSRWPEGRIGYVNGNPLDLRIENLLEGAHGKGLRIYSNNKSGVCGVFWDKSKRRWKASPRLNGVQINLGSFTDFEEAEAAVSKFYSDNNFLEWHGKKPVAA
ncbi:hypothetical protein [Pistricoccus aurantiacus]|uniref:hypothetical protein n=1 Tax=Pistricoccus aurantiacus TaxID=1883414 RepID=UPI00363813D8